MARERVVFLRFFVGDKARRCRDSGRGLNALVVVHCDINGRGLSGMEVKAVAALFGDTHRRQSYLPNLSAPPTGGNCCAGGLSCTPLPVAVEELVTAAIAMRKVLVAAMAMGEVVRAVVVQRVVACAMFMGEVNVHAVTALVGWGHTRCG